MKAALAAVLLAFGGCRPAPTTADAAPIGDFAMTAVEPTRTREFRRADLMGRVWVADVIYTRCSGPCPAMTGRMRQLAGELPEAVGLLSVSADPATDTPDRMREYASRHRMEAPRWVFLRGDVAATYQFAFAGLKLPISTRPEESEQARVMHSTRFVLIDKTGTVRGQYDGLSDVAMSALAREARRLSKEGA